jgi:hypothetical protein
MLTPFISHALSYLALSLVGRGVLRGEKKCNTHKVT